MNRNSKTKNNAKNLKVGPAPDIANRSKRKPGARYKATKEEITKRLDIIERMILQGRESDIVHYCAQVFNISERQTKKYKKIALIRIQKSTEKDREKNISKAIQMSQIGYAETLKSERGSNAAAKFLDIFCKLTGTYEAEKMQIEAHIGHSLRALAEEGKVSGPSKK